MRENRTCSSEGGEPGDRASLPYRRVPKFLSCTIRRSRWRRYRSLCAKPLKRPPGKGPAG